MEESLSMKSCVSSLSDYHESLVDCCVCRRPVSDPVSLNCLHSGCRSCLVVGSAGGENSSIKCPVCCEATHCCAIMSNSFLCNYSRQSALASQTLNCCSCDDDSVTAAAFWCADCCTGLCDSCCSWHNRFNHRHRSAELETARTWSVSQRTPYVQCFTHKRQMEMHCYTCREPKCLLCCESCRASQHEVQRLLHANTRKHIAAVAKAITSIMEQLCCRISGLQQKCRDTRRHLEVTHRKDSHGMLVQHKRFLRDASVNAFDRSVHEVCINLERIWCMSTTVMVRPVALGDNVSFATRCFGPFFLERLVRIELLRKKSLLEGFIIRNASLLAALLRRRRKYWQENGDFSVGGCVPLTSAIVLRSCLGSVERKEAAVRAPMQFNLISVTFRTPVDCVDLAVTRDGHVLLAADEHGLLVYSDWGQQLSSWKPERHRNRRDDLVRDDMVNCVAALSDGRAAVGVFRAQLVVLLKQSETGDRWLEDRRVAVLQSPPRRLAVHSDILAAAEYRWDEQRQARMPGSQVTLLRLSSGHVLYTHSRDYDVRVIALTALCLLTMSEGRVKRNSGARPCVLDAFSHSGEFLWRYETSDEEGVTGLCASTDTWRCVYVAVWRGDLSSRRVMAISGSDGRDVRDVMSSRTHGLQLPWLLSLARGHQRTVLAVLSRDRAARQNRTVSLYEAVSGRGQ